MEIKANPMSLAEHTCMNFREHEKKEGAGDIYRALSDASKAFGAVAKDDINSGQGFKYRGIESLMNAAWPALNAQGITILPIVLQHEHETTTNARGTQMTRVYLKVQYDLVARDGSRISAITAGEGMDSGDKATNKAMSAAYKYALMQVFCIPFDMVDGDAESPETTAPAVPLRARTPQHDGNYPAPAEPLKAEGAGTKAEEPEMTTESAKPKFSDMAPNTLPTENLVAMGREEIAHDMTTIDAAAAEQRTDEVEVGADLRPVKPEVRRRRRAVR